LNGDEKGRVIYPDDVNVLLSYQIGLTPGQAFDEAKCDSYVKMGISFPEYVNPIVRYEWNGTEQRLSVFELNASHKSLNEIISERKLSSSEVLQIIKGLNQILFALHVHGLFHMNIEASNVLLVDEAPIRLLLTAPRLIYEDGKERLGDDAKRRVDYIQMGLLLLNLLGVSTDHPKAPLELLNWVEAQSFQVLEERAGALDALIAGILDVNHERAWGYDQIRLWTEQVIDKDDVLLVPFFVRDVRYDSLAQVSKAIAEEVISWKQARTLILTEEFKERVSLSCNRIDQRKFSSALYAAYADDAERLDHFLLLFLETDDFSPYGKRVDVAYLLELIENALNGASIDKRGKLLLQKIKKGSLSKMALTHSLEKDKRFEVVDHLHLVEALYNASSEASSFVIMKKALEISMNPKAWMIPDSIDRPNLFRFIEDYASEIELIPSERDYAQFLNDFLIPSVYDTEGKVRSLPLKEYRAFLSFFQEYQKNPLLKRDFEEICETWYVPKCVSELPLESPSVFVDLVKIVGNIWDAKAFFTEAQLSATEYRSMEPEVFAALSIDEFSTMANTISLGLTRRFIRKCARVMRNIRPAISDRDPLALLLEQKLSLLLTPSEAVTKTDKEIVERTIRLSTFFPFTETLLFFLDFWIRKSLIWVFASGLVSGSICASISGGKSYWNYVIIFGVIIEIAIIFFQIKGLTSWPDWVFGLGPVGGFAVATLIMSLKYFPVFKLGFLWVFGFGSLFTFVYSLIRTRSQGFRLLFPKTRRIITSDYAISPP
jgi:hypothetical protein